MGALDSGGLGMNAILHAVRDGEAADVLHFAELLVSTHMVLQPVEDGWSEATAGELAEFLKTAAASDGQGVAQ